MLAEKRVVMKRIILVIVLLVILIGVIVSFLAKPEPDALLKRARRKFDAGQFDKAKPELLKVYQRAKLSSGPRCEAKIFYATCFVRENDFVTASRELNTFIKEYPNSFWTPQAYFDLAYCYRNLNNLPAAVKLYHLIIKEFPTTAWAKYSQERLNELKSK
jgi:outer membrane protein assembly factor BamD (BamD/ComL family)